MPKVETPESILSERNYLWKIADDLYNKITLNGTLSSANFRQAISMAGNMFKDKMEMGFANTYFENIACFLEAFEQAKAQNMGPSV